MNLYHLSEESGIKIFEPRPSPQHYENINGNAVFAVNDIMLHNYLLPRDCPRVTYYAKADSFQSDIDKFIGNTDKKYIINIEEAWIERVNKTKLYLYGMPAESFELLDEGAGYYISYKPVKPVDVIKIDNLLTEIEMRNAELRILPSIKQLAGEVSGSSLQFSIIRLKNAI